MQTSEKGEFKSNLEWIKFINYNEQKIAIYK